MTSKSAEKSSDPVVVVSSDTHIGPLLQEDLRPYCPQKFLPEFDEYVREFEAYTEVQRQLYPEMYKDDGQGSSFAVPATGPPRAITTCTRGCATWTSTAWPPRWSSTAARTTSRFLLKGVRGEGHRAP